MENAIIFAFSSIDLRISHIHQNDLIRLIVEAVSEATADALRPFVEETRLVEAGVTRNCFERKEIGHKRQHMRDGSCSIDGG
jgi:hypothetical protein